MAFKKGQGGRPKGAVNKTTVEAKEAIALVAEKLGGPQAMLKWAKSDPDNLRIFWGSIYPKLLPLTVSGDKDAPVQLTITREIISRKV